MRSSAAANRADPPAQRPVRVAFSTENGVRNGRNGRPDSTSSGGRSATTTPSTPPAAKDGKSNSGAAVAAGEAWATVKSFSPDEKKLQDFSEELKKKMADCAMGPPKVQDIECRQVLVAWDACKVESAKFHLEMASGTSSEFKEIYCGAELKFSVEKLSPGTPYSFRSYCSSGDVKGDMSPVSKVCTKAAPPEVPIAPRLASRSRNTISLKWAAVADNGSAITSYVLQWDQGKKGGNFEELYQGKERTFKVQEKLLPGHSYSFRLRAVNDIGSSDFSTVTTQYTAAGVPSPPEAPCLVRRASTSITVSWTESESNGASITEYKLEMDDPNTAYGFRSAYSGDAKEYTCEKLVPAGTYKFRVNAVNSQGTSKPSEVASYTTLAAAPGAPQKVRLQGNPHPFSFSAEWDAPANSGGGDIVGYLAELAEPLGTESKFVYDGSARKCTASSLAPGQKYMLHVAAYSEEGGQGEWSQAVSVKLPATSPGSPSTPYVSGRPKSSSMLIAWGAPEFTGGAEITSYVLEVAKEGTTAFSPVYDGPRTSHNVATLQPGMSYQFRVKAGNSAGKGMCSATLEASTGAAPPGPPENVSCTGLSSSSLKLTWQNAPVHGAPIREYIVEQKQSEDAFNQVYRGKDMSCEVRSLKPSSSYSFRVAALSDAGQGSWSFLCSGQTLAGPPAAVTGLTLVTVSSDELTVAWRTPTANGSPIIHYHLEVVGGKQAMDESSTRATITDLRANTAYRIRVQAVNRIGSGPFSSVMTASTTASRPLPPVLELAGRYHNALKLRWTNRQGCDYSLQIADPEQNSFDDAYAGSSTSFKVTGLEPTTTYRLRVRAKNEAGPSDFSAVLSFQTTETPPAPPKDVKVEGIKEDCATVVWPAPKSSASATNSQLEVQCMDEGSEYRMVFLGDLSALSFALSGLRPGSKYSVRARIKEHSAIADSNSLYSAFGRALTFTTVLEAAASRESPKSEKSPKTPSSSSSSPASGGASHHGKPTQRGKKPRKTTAGTQTKSPVVANDQRQAVFIMVVFGVVAVLVAIATSLYFVSQ